MRAVIESIRRSPVAIAAASLLLWGGAVSRAQIILNPGESTNLSYLVGVNGMSVQVGDKLFDDFDFGYTDDNLNPGDNLQPSMVLVSPLNSPFGIGLSFQLPLAAVSNEMKDVKLQFSVQVINSSNLISDAHLSFVGQAVGAAAVDIAENIFSNWFGVGYIATLSNSVPANPSTFSDSVFFSKPLVKVWVQKDISVLAAGSSINDRAIVSIVDETFSQIPEPSTVMLSVAGLIGLCLVKRRK